MARPSQRGERRRELTPVLARTFAELGYRATTTAELARRCDVRENILYRLWPDKRAMFVAALDHVYAQSEAIWASLIETSDGTASTAETLLEYESTHQGELGLYRMVFAGLSETDDPEIAGALKRLYGRFQKFVRKQIVEHRGAAAAPAAPDPGLAAWAILGLGTVANVGRELGLLPAKTRARLLREVGDVLIGARG